MSTMIQATTAQATQAAPASTSAVQVIERKAPGYMKLYGDVLNQYLSLQSAQALTAVKLQLTARQVTALDCWMSKLQAGETPKQQHVSNTINSAWPVNYGSQQTERLMWGLTRKLLLKAPIANLTLDQLNSLHVSFYLEYSGDQVLVRDMAWDSKDYKCIYVTVHTYQKLGNMLQLVTA